MMPFRRVPIRLARRLPDCGGFSSCVARRRLIARKGASTTQPLLTADRQTLLDTLTRQYDAVRDFNAEVDMVPALGTAEKSKITEYKDVRAYILFRQPSDIRLIGLYPVVRTKAFDMVSNGLDFKLYVPSRNRFLVGKNEIEQPSPNKLENLRPQHFLDAMLVRPVDLKTEKVLLMNLTDEDNAFYIIPVVHENGNGQLQLSRSIWFNRYNLTIARQFIFDDTGNILTDARYSDWKSYDNVPFPKHIEINRPKDEYAVVIDVVKMDINKGVSQEKFALAQPEGIDAASGRAAARSGPDAAARAPSQRKNQEKVTGKLVFENLKHRPMRSLLSILLIGVPVTLILCLVGLSHGFIEDSQKRARGVGADIMIRPKSSSMLSLGYTMPIALVDYFRKQPHVKIATGVLNATVEGVTLGASGVDLKEFDAMSGGFVFKSGGPFQGPDDAIIDEYFADQKNYHAGDRIKMLNSDWRVAGVMESGKLSHIVLPLDSLQVKTGNTGKVSQIYLKLDDAANTRPPWSTWRSCRPWKGIRSMRWKITPPLLNVNNIPALKGFTIVIMGIGVVIGFAVVCLSMYMSVLQRTREIGILKSLGGSKAFILGIIMTEAFMLGIGGTILGILMSYGAYWLIHTLVPASLPMIIVYDWWLTAGGDHGDGSAAGRAVPGADGRGARPYRGAVV